MKDVRVSFGYFCFRLRPITHHLFGLFEDCVEQWVEHSDPWECKSRFLIYFLFMLQRPWSGNRQAVTISGLLEDQAIFSLNLSGFN